MLGYISTWRIYIDLDAGVIYSWAFCLDRFSYVGDYNDSHMILWTSFYIPYGSGYFDAHGFFAEMNMAECLE